MGRTYRLWFGLALLLAGCQTGLRNPTIAEAPTATTDPNGGIFSGCWVPYPSQWQDRILFVFAASYLGPEEGEGIYILDETLHPKTILQKDGCFEIRNISPGLYVLVVGPSSEEGLPYRTEGRIPRFPATAGENLSLGDLTLNQ